MFGVLMDDEEEVGRMDEELLGRAISNISVVERSQSSRDLLLNFFLQICYQLSHIIWLCPSMGWFIYLSTCIQQINQSLKCGGVMKNDNYLE